MNEQQFHQQTIRGLIQTTINRTHLDLERRGLIAFGTVIDWTNIRTLVQGIDILFRQPLASRRERVAVDNLIIEVRGRILHTIPGIANLEEFEGALKAGIKAYSRHIRRNHVILPANHRGFRQTLEDQFRWGILEVHQRYFQIQFGIRRYIEYEQRVTEIINQFFRSVGANPNFNNHLFQSIKQECCWCLYNYRTTPL